MISDERILSDQERRAINEFISEHWASFKSVATNYLSDDEIEELGGKLENE